MLWEAQFGDFVNGAQVIIDQFITSAEDEMEAAAPGSLALLLPHGYEGQGPEHSSARLERFLQLAALGNIRVAYPSTPAQYFHLLHRQAHSAERKPLVVMTPKSLLRHRRCVSAVSEITDTGFRLVLGDPAHTDDLDRVGHLLLCSGKVYYDLDAHRREHGIDNVAICRIEQLYPFPRGDVARLLKLGANARDVAWVQEEPQNMGAWGYVGDRVRELLVEGQSLRYVGRPRASSPAAGSFKRHQVEQKALLDDALERRRSDDRRQVAATPSAPDSKS